MGRILTVARIHKPGRNIIMLTLFLVACLAFQSWVTAADHPSAWQKATGKDTVFLLLPDPSGKQIMTDATGKYKVEVSGGEVVPDPKFGSCVRLGDGEKNVIKVKDSGNAEVFKGGVTFEAWVLMEKPMAKDSKGATLAMKIGSYCWSITNTGKLNNSWMVIPNEKVATDKTGQFDHYPIGFGEINGEMDIPAGQWVHLAVTYDEKTKTFRTWIDGSVDRERESHYEGDLPLCCKPNSDYVFLQGMRNCKVAAIRILTGARNPGTAKPMSLYVNQFPWENKVTVTLDRISDSLKMPLDVVVMLQHPSGSASTVARARIEKPVTTHIDFGMSSWRRAMYEVIVKVFSEHNEVFEGKATISQPKPAGPIVINPDKSVSISGKKMFPLMMYHVFPKDFPELSKMGFNILTPRSAKKTFMSLAGNEDDDIVEMRANLEAAAQNGMYMTMSANTTHNHLRCVDLIKGQSGLLAWYSFDEPWGRLEKVQECYNILKLIDPNHPVIIIQNNMDRLKETATGADILGVDIYPIPNVSLRSVAEGTKAAVNGVFGRKPVWTVLPSYAYKTDCKLPTKEELRCMAYLAVCAGANGIGIYAWDEEELKSFKEKGYYMKNYPESVKILAEVIGELKKLEPILVVPNAPDEVAFATRNPALHAAVKKLGDKRYLFIANDNRQDEEGCIVLRKIVSAIARPMPECGFASEMAFKEGKAKVTLPKLSAAIFELVENQ